MWAVNYKKTKKDPRAQTKIEAPSSQEAWVAWSTYKVTAGITDYYTVEAVNTKGDEDAQ